MSSNDMLEIGILLLVFSSLTILVVYADKLTNWAIDKEILCITTQKTEVMLSLIGLSILSVNFVCKMEARKII